MLDGTNGSTRGILKDYKGGASNMGNTPVGSRGMVKSSSVSVLGGSKRCVSNAFKGGVPKCSKEDIPKCIKEDVPKEFKKSVPSHRLGE